MKAKKRSDDVVKFPLFYGKNNNISDASLWKNIMGSYYQTRLVNNNNAYFNVHDSRMKANDK